MILNTTIRPGLLVHVSTSIKGNVSYDVTRLGTKQTVEGEIEEWDTKRLTRDVDEQERASKARSLARSKIQSVCIPIEPGGLLCPQDRADQLALAEAEALRIVEEFNDSAQITRLTFRVVTGSIAPSDARAIKMINQELRDLMESMAEGMASLDVKKIREAADRATQVNKMLPSETGEQVKKAIELARKTATDMRKAAEVGAAEVDQVAIARIQEARTAFLDLDDNQGTIGEVEHAGRSLDLAPEAPAPVTEPAAQGRMFEV